MMNISKKSISILSKNHHWTTTLLVMRDLLLTENLTESIKWSRPVYSYDDKNILSIQGFKNHFGVWFFNGVFLKDPHGILINVQEGKTKAMRHLQYNSPEEVDLHIFMSYVREAIQVQKDGKKINPTIKKKLDEIPKCMIDRFKDTTLKEAFDKLTLGRKNEYIAYINDAKRNATKESRMEKIIPLILKGKGLNDQYR